MKRGCGAGAEASTCRRFPARARSAEHRNGTSVQEILRGIFISRFFELRGYFFRINIASFTTFLVLNVQ